MQLNRDSAIPIAMNIDALQHNNRILFQQLKKTAEDQVHQSIDRELQSMAVALQTGSKLVETKYSNSSTTNLSSNSVGNISSNEIRAFVGENLVIVNVRQVQHLENQLRSHIDDCEKSQISTSIDPIGRSTNGNSIISSLPLKKTLARLSSMLKNLNVPPPLPPMVFG